MNRLPILLFTLVAASFCHPVSAAEKPLETAPVFPAGENGYHTFRIPGLIVTKPGTLLAFCEGRKDNAGDHGDIDLVLKRSEDGGKTWSKMQIVHEEGGTEKVTIGNPCPVVDAETGTIWLPFCRDNDDVFMTHSTDDGKTWAAPVDITATTKKDGWDWYATGPGHGIQIERGPQAGRLVIPCDHREEHEGSGEWKKKGRSHVIFSDDHGKTWRLGGVTDLGMNECEVVERADGSLLLSMRNYLGKNLRAFSVSTDGGESWSAPEHNAQVYCPTCQSSIHRVSLEPENLIFYSGPGGPGRENLTIRASLNDGQTWPIWRELFHGKAAYSDLAVLPAGEIGCLFEGGENAYNEAIRFVRFPKERILQKE